jgi:hypothetical protein
MTFPSTSWGCPTATRRSSRHIRYNSSSPASASHCVWMWHCSGQQPWMSRSCCLVTKSSVMGPQRSRHRDQALLQPAISIHTTTLDRFKPMSSVTSVTKPATTKRFSPVEIADRHKNGRCFHCDKFFTQWHKIVGKHMFVIEVLNEPDEAMPVEKNRGPHDIHPCTNKHLATL